MSNKKRRAPRPRDFIAKELITSGKFRQRIVQNKKKQIKKFDWKRERGYDEKDQPTFFI